MTFRRTLFWIHLVAGIISGLSNKLQVAGSGIAPQSVLAEMHRGMAEPGSGEA